MRKTISSGHENDGLYLLDSSLTVATPIKKDISASCTDELFTWDQRLGHLSFSVLKKMFSQFFFF